MSKAIPHQFPENAWLTYAEAAKRWGKSSNPMHVEYRRADLPPTLEAAMQLPEVKALVEAVEYIVDGMGINGPEYKMDPNDEYADAANSAWVCDTLTRLCTAMSALSRDKP